jgi:hypothetical protein
MPAHHFLGIVESLASDRVHPPLNLRFEPGTVSTYATMSLWADPGRRQSAGRHGPFPRSSVRRSEPSEGDEAGGRHRARPSAVRHLRTVSTTPITFGRLGSLRPRLSEAARTDESNAEQAVDRFVELRPGLAETLGSSRNHLITGRRGTGKSTLLHLVRRQLRAENVAVAVIDMERYIQG